MKLIYKTLDVDEFGVECKVLRSQSSNFYVYQTNLENKARVKRAFNGACFFYKYAKDVFLEPISYNEQDDIATALYTYISSGKLSDFLDNAPDHMQYAIGKKCGRSLGVLHAIPLSEVQKQKAHKHIEKTKEKLYTYLTSLERMPNDGETIEAIGDRFDLFSVLKPVMRYGAFKADHILITKDMDIIFTPSSSYGEGDICEDFALLACEHSGNYPCFVAGAIDGYFGLKIPTQFYLGFALHCAFNSLYRCALRSQINAQEKIRMQEQSMRIQLDFLSFNTPIPDYLQSQRVKDARTKCESLNL